MSDYLDQNLASRTALVAAADATTTLRIGIKIFNNELRNPLILSKGAATLDVLTDGLFELGSGAGWHSDNYNQTGIPFDPFGGRSE